MRWIALVGMLFVGNAYAASTTLTYINPTQWDDGTPLAAADIVSRRVQWTGSCPDFAFVAAQNVIVVPGNAPELVVDNITAGTRCFRVFVTARDSRCTVTATETCLREGPASNVWTKTFSAENVAPRTPMAPTGLTGR